MSANKIYAKTCRATGMSATGKAYAVAPPSPSTASTATTVAEDVDLWDISEENTVPEAQIAGQLLTHRRRAHCTEDLLILTKFAEMVGIEIECTGVKLLLRAMKMLHLCDYSVQEVCSIMAHVSKYFMAVLDACGSEMDSGEVGYVITVLMYVAHSYVQDETCPLHIWHQHLFKRYCSLDMLNAAVFRLMEIQGFVLRVEPQDLDTRYNTFVKAANRERSAFADDFHDCISS